MSFDRYIRQQKHAAHLNNKMLRDGGGASPGGQNKLETNTLYLQSSRRGDQMSDQSRVNNGLQQNQGSAGISISVKPTIHREGSIVITD